MVNGFFCWLFFIIFDENHHTKTTRRPLYFPRALPFWTLRGSAGEVFHLCGDLAVLVLATSSTREKRNSWVKAERSQTCCFYTRTDRRWLERWEDLDGCDRSVLCARRLPFYWLDAEVILRALFMWTPYSVEDREGSTGRMKQTTSKTIPSFVISNLPFKLWYQTRTWNPKSALKHNFLCPRLEFQTLILESRPVPRRQTLIWNHKPLLKPKLNLKR